MLLLSVFVAFFAAGCAFSKTVHLSESFSDENSLNDWVSSTYNGENQGTFELSAGKDPVDPKQLGLWTPKDAKFYGISKKLETPFSTRGKPFVLQYTVKYDETVDCGGAYIKLFGSGLDQKQLHGDSEYLLMFGPDICGYSTKKVHVILTKNGKNHLIKKDIPCKTDLLTHLYTLILTPDNKYKVLIDNSPVEEGTLEDDWDIVPPKMIDDPKAVKPSDWVDAEVIDDPDDKKPDDWDQPKMIADENAKKPEDWDDEMDGEWERPQIENPNYKGDWSPKKISNPSYKGPWFPPQIENPNYSPNPDLYVLEDVSYIGFDLWQVKSGSKFDDILLTDDPEFAKEEGDRVWKNRYEAEKAQMEAKEAEAEAKAKEEGSTEQSADSSDDKLDDSNEEPSDNSMDETEKAVPEKDAKDEL